ncbi:MAG: GNAT family N-acetyltransferase [Fimbriimonas sp.]
MLRLATSADLPRVWDLILELAEFERLSHKVTGSLALLEEHFGKSFELIVCEQESVVIGYALFFTNFSTFLTRPGLYMEDLYVQPAFRGRGFGRQMLCYLIAEAHQRGCGRVEWAVLDWNESAIGFYQTMGAEVLPDWRICRLSL